MRLPLTFALLFAVGGAAQAAPDAKDIDKLYARLAKTQMADEAAGIVAEIDHLRQQSGSDTADLLFARAEKARQSDNAPLALQLLDAAADLDPGWSEVYSERAATKFETGDVSGAMADIAQTLKREPRDIAALSGLAALMLDANDPEAALKVYDQALKLAPAFAPLTEARARAETKLRSLSP